MDSNELLTNIKSEMASCDSTTSNFHINPSLKRRFKAVCSINAQSMSKVLETLMTSYIIKDHEMRQKLGK